MKHLKTFEKFIAEDLVKNATDVEDTQEVPADAGASTDKEEATPAEIETPTADKEAEPIAADVQDDSEEKAEGKPGDSEEIEKQEPGKDEEEADEA